MLQVEMSASVRNSSGKGPMRQLRMEGMTPAVVYGGGAEATMLQMDTKSLMAKLLKFYRHNTIVTLDIENAGVKTVMIGEVQTDPVRDTLVHVDFCEIDLEKERAYKVPIVYEGSAKGVDFGGVLVVGCTEVVFNGKPLNIPDEVKVDISNVAIDDVVKCSSFAVPDGVTMLTDGDTVAVSVFKPGKVEEDTEDDGDSDKKK
ncbi:MAG: large subunit ribosomal protein L25 [Desulforhopalus sp.]|jgi:large subunit ribosomal protein L25